MKTNKLLEMLAGLFNRSNNEQSIAEAELKEALQLIKKKQKELRARLKETTDPDERKELQEKITILHTQRSKGIDKLRNPNQPPTV